MPMIYRDEYNIRLYGIQKLHPFDSEKYAKVYSYLREKTGLGSDTFQVPEEISEADLRLVHNRAYLDSLKRSEVIAQIAELGLLRILPASVLDRKILKPMRYAVGGTVRGADLALHKGWAVNLSGGYHHAKAGEGSGFCFYADIPVAVKKLWRERPGLRVLIIDLDAHQGNGTAAVFGDDKRIFILDVYNRDAYPRDGAARVYIDYDYPLPAETPDKLYLKTVRRAVPAAMEACKPQLVIYNSGTDILDGDRLGGMRVSAGGIVQRDELVFREALKRKIPILMVLSGGYTRRSGHITGQSLENILRNDLKMPH